MGELDFEKVTRSFGAKGVGNSATSTQFSYTSIIQSVLGANDSKNSCEELCHTSSSLLDNQEADLPRLLESLAALFRSDQKPEPLSQTTLTGLVEDLSSPGFRLLYRIQEL
ncbi:hypothetical protein AXG93_4542s1200 [Marchantia polymorpha subsp. ruderalis]|uniref:Uncharacterized protein n=1 Tax=Marchantia polymorpha subsp. ruderalis TaxID=1480154 RepID=A0A176W0L5_MARPO|nr:hypothetical protein AXG93_4542s1200 [Marchantia polymorpha subsp. ruderalis]